MIDITKFTDWEDTFAMILADVKGFPEDTIIREYILKNNIRTDILININGPLAVVEIRIGEIDKNKLKDQLIKLINSFDEDIEAYSVVFDNPKISSKQIVKYYKLNKLTQELEVIENFPSYSYFKSLKLKKIVSDLSSSNKFFTISSFILGFLLLVYHFVLVFCLDKDIETNQLFILLIGLVLLYIPFISRFKIAGFEIERMLESKKINIPETKDKSKQLIK